MKILKQGAKECLKDLPFQVNWIITNDCNYRCTYCFHYGKGKTPPPHVPFATLEQLRIAVDNIASLNRPWYDIIFSGGEPTVQPHLFELISMLHETLGERLNNVLIITNGSRNKKLYKGLSGLAESINVELNISIHTDHVDMNHILELIENLSADIRMHFSLMFNPDKRDFVHEIYDIMLEQRKKHWFTMRVAMLSEGSNIDPRYTPEDFTWQKAANEGFRNLVKSVNLSQTPRKRAYHGLQLFTDIEDNGEKKTLTNVDYNQKYVNSMVLFKGMYCVACAYLLSIWPNGWGNGMVCNDDRVWHNIYSKNCFQPVLSKLIHAVKCTKPNCTCSANYPIPKFASEEDAKKYVEFAQKRQAQLFDEYLSATNK